MASACRQWQRSQHSAQTPAAALYPASSRPLECMWQGSTCTDCCSQRGDLLQRTARGQWRNPQRRPWVLLHHVVEHPSQPWAARDHDRRQGRQTACRATSGGTMVPPSPPERCQYHLDLMGGRGGGRMPNGSTLMRLDHRKSPDCVLVFNQSLLELGCIVQNCKGWRGGPCAVSTPLMQ